MQDDFIQNLTQVQETFSQYLFGLIDKRASFKNIYIDRKLLSKVRCNKYYQPSKNTAILFALALSLDIDDTKKLLEKAGFVLSNDILFDRIITYFITNKIYDIQKINYTLMDSINTPLLK